MCGHIKRKDRDTASKSSTSQCLTSKAGRKEINAIVRAKHHFFQEMLFFSQFRLNENDFIILSRNKLQINFEKC